VCNVTIDNKEVSYGDTEWKECCCLSSSFKGRYDLRRLEDVMLMISTRYDKIKKVPCFCVSADGCNKEINGATLLVCTSPSKDSGEWSSRITSVLVHLPSPIFASSGRSTQ
jgi:hypothetical protein